MTARVLVVDDILANVRLLEAKLTSEYFEVCTAMNGADALEAVDSFQPDIILLDVMMPGIDGIEVCRRIKTNPQTQHIPVIMVTALDQVEDRVRGLEAGADDFITKPVNDAALFCRLKSLVRLKMLMDELRGRNDGPVLEGDSDQRVDLAHVETAANVAVVDNRGVIADRIEDSLGSMHKLHLMSDPAQTVRLAQETELDLIIISFDLLDHDGLRLCSQLRSFERTRQIPILVVVDIEDQARLMRALDMGVNDYLHRPLDKLELKARVNTQIKRKRYTDRLRLNVTRSMELAVTDPLTGLYNRRHMDNQLAIHVSNAASRGKPVSLLALDVDFFKPINDTHGHDVGDRVLQELASRLKSQVRAIDLCCRMGGEEFVVILPETDLQVGFTVAERLRRTIASKPFNAGAKYGPLSITVSIGVAAYESVTDTPETLLKRADEALYHAKRSGRNRVMSDAA
ncbi:MAG: PleD family two-component system response regulator [Anderseniella sp.]|jgi:two-component system cell cycle response regulator|nr:PleD family two-component system response regulator [Anderseniella sp.]